MFNVYLPAQAARTGVMQFLPKPYTAEAILSALAQTLGKA
jgi:FixJ family two-component response regulator